MELLSLLISGVLRSGHHLHSFTSTPHLETQQVPSSPREILAGGFEVCNMVSF